MSALRIAIGIAWAVFWICWLISAAAAKPGPRSRRMRLPTAAVIAVVVVLLRVLRVGNAEIHSLVVEVIGTIVFVAGLGLAVWARIYLGRNWGMPMTQKDEPELVTSGPYRFVRHPIYSGILLAVLGTALAVSLYWLIVLAISGTYFVYSATVEEKLMEKSFPAVYPEYRAHTKMLIPYLL